MQRDVEQRGERGRGASNGGSFTQRGDDRDYDRVYDNYGESSGEIDPRQARAQGYGGSERERTSDRDRYAEQVRSGRHGDEGRGEQRRFEQGRSEQGDRSGRGGASRYEMRERDWSDDASGRRSTGHTSDEGRTMRQGGYDQGRYDQGDYGQRRYDQHGGGWTSTPYDQGEISSWYGGDSGMGDTGSSLSGGPSTRRQSDRGWYSQGQANQGQPGWGQSGWDQPSRGQHEGGWRESSQRQASSQYGQPRHTQQQYDQDQYRDRFSGGGSAGSTGNWQPAGGWQPDWNRSMQGQSGAHDTSLDGPFTGRGPRGYHRSDERIYEEVCELLTRHGDIDASMMEVEVRNGIVFLRGAVDSGRVRRLTEEVVEGVAGVRDVRNDLRVNQRTGYAETASSDLEPSTREWSGAGQPGMARSDTAHTDTGRTDTGRAETGRSTWERTQATRSETDWTQPGRTETGEPGTHQTGMTGQAGMTGQPGTRQGGSIDTSAPAYGTGVANTSGAVSSVEQTQHAEAGGAQIGSRFTIREAMDVVGSDGVIIGQVKETRGTDFLVDRPMQRDVYVPFSAVQTVDGDRVVLETAARDVDSQGWPTPDLAGASQQRPSGGG